MDPAFRCGRRGPSHRGHRLSDTISAWRPPPPFGWSGRALLVAWLDPERKATKPPSVPPFGLSSPNVQRRSGCSKVIRWSLCANRTLLPSPQWPTSVSTGAEHRPGTPNIAHLLRGANRHFLSQSCAGLRSSAWLPARRARVASLHAAARRSHREGAGVTAFSRSSDRQRRAGSSSLQVQITGMAAGSRASQHQPNALDTHRRPWYTGGVGSRRGSAPAETTA